MPQGLLGGIVVENLLTVQEMQETWVQSQSSEVNISTQFSFVKSCVKQYCSSYYFFFFFEMYYSFS